VLEVDHLSKSFDGFAALRDVSLRVEPKETHAIIGPNGAGKTTFFNLITGHLRADEGAVRFYGEPLIGLSPHEIVRHGIARSFQHINIFPRLTALACVQTAVIAQQGQQLRLFGGTNKQRREAEELLTIVGLQAEVDRIAGELAYGQQKQLELALALAAQPRVLLLDEPTAGMSAEETRQATGLIKRIQEARGLSLLFTEHDMEVVFGIADRISVLDHGELIASGRPQEIRDNPEVRRIYLGEGE
jgi:branched-chain amino acid transport system ATP-binding protein